MKFFILVADGAGDEKIAALRWRTPLEVATLPVLNGLAKNSIVGRCKTIPDGMEAGSDVANLSILGFDPKQVHTGRAPLEAEAMGFKLNEEDIAFRVNLVSLSGGEPYERKVMVDYSGGQISTENANTLIDAFKRKYFNDVASKCGMELKWGTGYRGALVMRNQLENISPKELSATPPHNIIGEVIKQHLPIGEGSKGILQFMRESSNFFDCKYRSNLELDIDRKKKPYSKTTGNRYYEQKQGVKTIYDSHNLIDGYVKVSEEDKSIIYEASGNTPDHGPVANALWVWGGGRKPNIESHFQKRNIKGTVITAVDLIRGIGLLSGLSVTYVDGATGDKGTNFQAKGSAAIDAFKSGCDLVFLHVEAPDECAHQGDLDGKIWCLEKIDQDILKPVVEYLNGCDQAFRLLFMPDHLTPVEKRNHTEDPVPFLFYDSKYEQAFCEERIFSEEWGMLGPYFEQGWELIGEFLK